MKGSLVQFSDDDIRLFEADYTIQILQNPESFVGKITKKDIKKSARDLLKQIEEHPSMKVYDFVKDSPDFEERKRTYKARSVVRDAFSGGFGPTSDMFNSYNALYNVIGELHNISEGIHIFTSANKLGDKLVKAFEKLEQIDKRYDRKQMIQSFAERLKHEIQLESGESGAIFQLFQEVGARIKGADLLDNHTNITRADGKTWTDASARKGDDKGNMLG
nr:hypothetical protein 16 [bacterium]